MTDTSLPSPVQNWTTTELVSQTLAEPSPKDRLCASRASVRSALEEITHPPSKTAGSGLGDKLAGALRGIPGADIVLATAKGWWKDHDQTARTTGQAWHALLKPVVRRYPASAVGAAAATGAVLFLLKPWRWLLRPQILVAVGSLFATQAIKGRSSGAWLQTALSLAGKSKRPR